jgi:hypothetical protein
MKNRWAGPLGFEGFATGDNRFIENGALRWDTLPIPLRYASEDFGAHDGAQVVGHIDSIVRLQPDDPQVLAAGVKAPAGSTVIWGTGDFDLEGVMGAEAARHVDSNLTNGISMDLDDVSFEVRGAQLSDNASQKSIDQGAEMMVTTSARMRASTIVAIPAFEGAKIHMAVDTVEDTLAAIELNEAEIASLEAAFAAAPASTPIGSKTPMAKPAAKIAPKAPMIPIAPMPEMPAATVESILADLKEDLGDGTMRTAAVTSAIATADKSSTPKDAVAALTTAQAGLDPKDAVGINAVKDALTDLNKMMNDKKMAARQGIQRWAATQVGKMLVTAKTPAVPLSPSGKPTLPLAPGDDGSNTDDNGADEIAKAAGYTLDEETQNYLSPNSAAAISMNTPEDWDIYFEGNDDGDEGSATSIEDAISKVTAYEAGDFSVVDPKSADDPSVTDPMTDVTPEDQGSSAMASRMPAAPETADDGATDFNPTVDEVVGTNLSVDEEGMPDNDPNGDAEAIQAGVDAGFTTEQATTALGQAKQDAINYLTEKKKKDAEVKAEEQPGVAASPAGTAAPMPKMAATVLQFNWVEKVGGLPEYIKRIADHLKEKGMTESHAIATAVNTVKRWARGGEGVHPDTIAKAGAALADWEAKKAASHLIPSMASASDQAMPDAPGVLADGTAPMCSYCQNKANKYVIHSEGMAFIPFCDDHGSAAMDDAGTSTPDGMADPSNINSVGSYALATDGEQYEPEQRSALVASGALAAPIAPPLSWFENPQFEGPTALTVTKEGRVYGHMSTWDVCHLAMPNGVNECVSAPHSMSDYAWFHLGYVETEDGTNVPVGRITMNTVHAGGNWNSSKTIAHYENTGLAIADVHAGEDAYGIWFAGALRPDATPEQIRALRASPLSGDWRRNPSTNNLELTMALAVNQPGFPVPRPQGLVASGALQSLVAAGMLAPTRVIAPAAEGEEPKPGQLSKDDLRYLQRLAQRERDYEAGQLRMRVILPMAQSKIEAFAAKRAKAKKVSS